MAVDTSKKAEAQWEALSKAESSTIDKVLSGNATKADTDRLLKLINQYSKLAGEIFQRGVTIIEDTADKRIAKEVKKREKQIGGELPDAEVAAIVQEITQSVYQERGSDLLQAIEEMVNSATESFEQFSDEDYNEAVDAAKSQYEELIRRLKVQTKGPRQEKKVPVQGSSEGMTVEDVLADIYDSLGLGESGTTTDEEDASQTSGWFKRHDADSTVSNQEHKEAVKDWATEWWRKFKQFGGQLTSRPKDTAFDLLKEVAKLAGMAYIFSPDFRNWIDSKLADVGNWFTMDNVQKLLGEAWTFIKKEASDFVDNMKEWFGIRDYDSGDLDKDHAALMRGIEEQTAKVEEAKADAAKIQKAIDERNAASDGGVWDTISGGYANSLDELSIWGAKRREASARKELEELKEKLRENEQAQSSSVAAAMGMGSSTSSAAPPMTSTSAQAPFNPAAGVVTRGDATSAAPTTSTAVASTNIETSATPPSKAETPELERPASGTIVPPAGGAAGNESYVPPSRNGHLALSNMF